MICPHAAWRCAGDDSVRRHTYRADGGEVLLFGSNMALRASAWKLIANEVCLDKEDVMHEDIDVSLHLLGRGLKTVYSERMICGISRAAWTRRSSRSATT